MSVDIKTSAGTKPVDPYKAKSFEATSLDKKIEDLVNFISDIKYGMLTTKMSSDPDLLTSRCMAIAGKVRPCIYQTTKNIEKERKKDKRKEKKRTS